MSSLRTRHPAPSPVSSHESSIREKAETSWRELHTQTSFTAYYSLLTDPSERRKELKEFLHTIKPDQYNTEPGRNRSVLEVLFLPLAADFFALHGADEHAIDEGFCANFDEWRAALAKDIVYKRHLLVDEQEMIVERIAAIESVLGKCLSPIALEDGVEFMLRVLRGLPWSFSIDKRHRDGDELWRRALNTTKKLAARLPQRTFTARELYNALHVIDSRLLLEAQRTLLA